MDDTKDMKPVDGWIVVTNDSHGIMLTRDYTQFRKKEEEPKKKRKSKKKKNV